jgi:hypothetical protein
MNETKENPDNKPAATPSGKNTQWDVKLQQWDLVFKAFTTLAVIAGTIYGLVEYFDKREKELSERKRDYEFTLYKERKETLYPLCNAAADIASSKSLKEAQKAIKTFETMYLGEVGIIADGQIAESIKLFDEALQEFKEGARESPPPAFLLIQSSKLALKCKEVLDLERVYGLSPTSKGPSLQVVSTIGK